LRYGATLQERACPPFRKGQGIFTFPVLPDESGRLNELLVFRFLDLLTTVGHRQTESIQSESVIISFDVSAFALSREQFFENRPTDYYTTDQRYQAKDNVRQVEPVGLRIAHV